jgi:hypothetical protein
MQNTQTLLDKKQAAALIKEFFDQFQNSCNKPKQPNSADFQKFLAPDFHITSNDHPLAKNLQEYMVSLANVQKKYSNFKVVPSKEELIISKNKVVIEYELHANSIQTKQPVKILMMAIATVEDNKFKNWIEVSHQKGAGQWNA